MSISNRYLYSFLRRAYVTMRDNKDKLEGYPMVDKLQQINIFDVMMDVGLLTETERKELLNKGLKILDVMGVAAPVDYTDPSGLEDAGLIGKDRTISLNIRKEITSNNPTRMSSSGAKMLILLEGNKTNLHTPGDGTITYGTGEVVQPAKTDTNGNSILDKPVISAEMKKKYPDMTKEEASTRLKNIVLPKYEARVNDELLDAGLAVNQEQYDALTSAAYNHGNATKLINAIASIQINLSLSDSEKNTAIICVFKSFYSKSKDPKIQEVLQARRQTEGALFKTKIYPIKSPYK